MDPAGRDALANDTQKWKKEDTSLRYHGSTLSRTGAVDTSFSFTGPIGSCSDRDQVLEIQRVSGRSSSGWRSDIEVFQDVHAAAIFPRDQDILERADPRMHHGWMRYDEFHRLESSGAVFRAPCPRRFAMSARPDRDICPRSATPKFPFKGHPA